MLSEPRGEWQRARLDHLVALLYEHADAHDGTLESDLREAASRLEQMAIALRVVHTWATVPGALDPKHTAAMTANALRNDRAGY